MSRPSGTSMDHVTGRAAVGKSALHRRWASKLELTASVRAVLSGTVQLGTDAGTLEADVRAPLDGILDCRATPHTCRMIKSLLAEARRNPALADALMDHVRQPRRMHAQAGLDCSAGDDGAA